jgi:hypothetical protein
MEDYFSIVAKSANLGDDRIDDQYIEEVFRQANEHRSEFNELWLFYCSVMQAFI